MKQILTTQAVANKTGMTIDVASTPLPNHDGSRSYSAFSAAMGSVRAARHAGKALAPSATKASNKGTETKVVASYVLVS